MSAATLNGLEDMLRVEVSDEDLEATAEETALAYTYQTSRYNPCCI